MRAWTVVDRVESVDGVLELRRRDDDDFLIVIDGRVLMNSRANRSELGLAQLACRGLSGKKAPSVLIGGLGMACTLRAALDLLPPAGRVVVAELNRKVVDWCQGPLSALTNGAVVDRRVDVRIENVINTVASAEKNAEHFDAVLLDLYEGPDRSSTVRSDPLYGREMARRVRRILKPGGVFAVWCEQDSAPFERNLREAGYAVQRHRIGRGGMRHSVYVAATGG